MAKAGLIALDEPRAGYATALDKRGLVHVCEIGWDHWKAEASDHADGLVVDETDRGSRTDDAA